MSIISEAISDRRRSQSLSAHLTKLADPLGGKSSFLFSDFSGSINIVGLINPVTVDKKNNLIAGEHRMEACRHLGFDEIECSVLDCDELRMELAEIDENLIRNDLHYTIRGELAKRRDEILTALGLRAKKSPGT